MLLHTIKSHKDTQLRCMLPSSKNIGPILSSSLKSVYGLDILVPSPRETTNTQCERQAVSFSTGNKSFHGTSAEYAEKSLSTSSSAHNRILFTRGETSCFTLGETSCRMKSNDEFSSWYVTLDMLARTLNCPPKKKPKSSEAKLVTKIHSGRHTN